VGASGLTFSPDGKHVAGIAGGVRIWDSETGKEVMSFPDALQGPLATCLAYSPDGKMLAIGLANGVWRTSYVQIWDVGQVREIVIFPCHQDLVFQVAWSPDGSTLATCSSDATVKLWDAPTILKKAGR
jgi:WD40 repeat protein